jgi:S-adenosylmethionine:tRNA ribosyltransferase-isomerase
MKTSDFDYNLPPELIAQVPLDNRERSRLLVLDRSDGSINHRHFFELPDYLRPGDVIVFNNSRVIRARLRGVRQDNGKTIEVLLLRPLGDGVWETLVGSGKRAGPGTTISIAGPSAGSREFPTVSAEVIETREGGIKIIRFSDESVLPQLGEVPLPPYIHVPLADPERYQTVYSAEEGSVAAPTAGLHFTKEIIDKIKTQGVECLFVTLHVGLNTFRPVRVENPLEHLIHPEYGVVSPEVAESLNRARRDGRRVICVGTTSIRLVENAAQSAGSGDVPPFEGWADLFIVPGYQFKVAAALITNFHLPRSTLLMLVSAFAGTELIQRAYQEAIEQKYRFYSFGDAMLII